MRYRLVFSPRPDGSAPPARRLLVAAAVLAAGAALFAGAFYLTVRWAARSNEVLVPDLAGLDLEAATARVEPVGLVLQVVEERNDPAVPSGRVLEQVPHAGSAVQRGRKVKLVLSLGGQVLRIPDLVGRAARAVDMELGREGLAAGETAHVPSRDAPAGSVIAQVPPAGTPAVPRARVHRLVSDGPPVARWVMPDLTGVGRDEAERWISSAGFRRGAVRRVRMVGRAPDTVIGQSPLAGYPVGSRDVVELTVAQ